MVSEPDHDLAIRVEAFDWLSRLVSTYGSVLPRNLLSKGFPFNNQQVFVISQRGIFKPKVMQIPLSVTTSPANPLGNVLTAENLLKYRYFGRDPFHSDNRGLRKAMNFNLPLVYFRGLKPGSYRAYWPVYIVDDSLDDLTFTIDLHDAVNRDPVPLIPANPQEISELAHVFGTASRRYGLFRKVFRKRVIRAYQFQCAFCGLRHTELLDASHIVPAREPEGIPTVNNGMALCKLHHAAFDEFLMGVRPDYRIEVRPDILHEEDGPTLEHAIQSLHGKCIRLPIETEKWPSKCFLEEMYSRFCDRWTNL